jgi:hypothetical protein
MPHPKVLVLTVQCEVQLYVRPTTCPEGTQEQQGYSSATSAVDGIGSQRYNLAALPPGESPGIYLRLRGPHGLYVRQWKRLLAPALFELRTAQPVASSYVDFSILDPDRRFSVLFPQL